MNNFSIQLLWWAVPVIVLLVAYKFVLRVFFGMVIVPDDRVGLVIKNMCSRAINAFPMAVL